jgi:2-polyprenyl-6-methoxyphenol hydroxylase-like FAD-dependent oxidoreductase
MTMKVIICGAGITGLAAAWWLECDGWQVTLVEQAPGPRDEGYMIDFLGPGYDVAERMGLLPRLAEIQTSIDTIHYVRPDGRSEGTLHYNRFLAALDGRGFTFLRGDLERVLRDAVADRVDIRYHTTIEKVAYHDGGPVEVVLDDGRAERTDLLVGADGIHSRVRSLVFGPQAATERYLGYHTASYLLDDKKLRAQVGDRFLVVAVPDRQVGLYPTGDGRLAAWLVHKTSEPALPANPARGIRRAYVGMGELVARTLSHCPQEHGLYYDRVSQIEMTGWTRGSVTLAGDACQAVSLMAGQGASMAVGAAYVLAGELRRTADIPSALFRYERRLRPLIKAKQKAGRGTARWLVPAHQWQLNVRAVAFAAMRLPGAAWLIRPAVKAMRETVVDPSDHPETARPTPG